MKSLYKMTPQELIDELRERRRRDPEPYDRTKTDPNQCEIKSHRACKCGDYCLYGKKRNLNE